MSAEKQLEDLKASWAALAEGDMDKLAGFYAEETIFVLPGQEDVLQGRTAFRAALDGIGEALPPGFDIKDLRYCPGDNEIVNIVEFTSDKRIQLPRDTGAGYAGVSHQAEVLAAAIIIDRQDAEPTRRSERIGQEVQRPAFARS